MEKLTRAQKAAQTRRENKIAREAKQKQQAERERALWNIVTSDLSDPWQKDRAIALLLTMKERF